MGIKISNTEPTAVVEIRLCKNESVLPPESLIDLFSHTHCWSLLISNLAVIQRLISVNDSMSLLWSSGHSSTNRINWLTSRKRIKPNSTDVPIKLITIAPILLTLCLSSHAHNGYKRQLINTPKDKGMNNGFPKYKITEIKKTYWRFLKNVCGGTLTCMIYKITISPVYWVKIGDDLNQF